jgi:hypothetical protein
MSCSPSSTNDEPASLFDGASKKPILWKGGGVDGVRLWPFGFLEPSGSGDVGAMGDAGSDEMEDTLKLE